jgi:hypothetical protein
LDGAHLASKEVDAKLRTSIIVPVAIHQSRLHTDNPGLYLRMY